MEHFVSLIGWTLVGFFGGICMAGYATYITSEKDSKRAAHILSLRLEPHGLCTNALGEIVKMKRNRNALEEEAQRGFVKCEKMAENE